MISCMLLPASLKDAAAGGILELLTLQVYLGCSQCCDEDEATFLVLFAHHKETRD